MNKVQIIKVMFDFCSSGIWNLKNGVMIDYDEINISKELEKNFETWIDETDTEHTDRETYFVKQNSEDIVNNRGRELARRLKREKPEFTIYYVPEYYKKIGPKELIQ